jgi:two-component system cell cycle response regulator DivK
MKILYVEDNAINALVLSKFFKDDDFHTEESAEAALALLKHMHFDIILIDINLGRGNMDGVEFLDQLRAYPHLSTVPKIAVTAYAMPLDEEKYLKLGFDAYFSKPVAIHALKETLSTYNQAS